MRAPAAYRNYSRRARAVAWGLDLAAAPLAPLLRRLAPPGRPPGTPRSILVIRLDHLGDLLMTTPALAALRHAFPTARIDVLAAPWGRRALAGNPHINEVLEAVAPWYDPRRGEPPRPDEILPVALRLRRRAYDWGFDMRGDPRVTLLYLLPAARRRFGFAALGLESLLTDAIPYDRHRAPLDLALDLAGLAGAPAAERRPVFAPDDAARRRVAARLAAAGLPPGTPFAVVAPGSNRPAARWGGARFAALCDGLRGSGLQVLLTGADADAPLIDEVAALSRQGAIGGLRLDLPELAAALERAALFVGNDSGATHLAAAVGCPAVAIFGPGDPALTFPYGADQGGDPATVAIAAPIDHPRPCFNLDCDSDHGFGSITPDRVLQICRETIAAAEQRDPASALPRRAKL